MFLRKNSDLPVVGENHKPLPKFNSGTLRIKDAVRLMSLFELLLEHSLEFVLGIYKYLHNK